MNEIISSQLEVLRVAQVLFSGIGLGDPSLSPHGLLEGDMYTGLSKQSNGLGLKLPHI